MINKYLEQTQNEEVKNWINTALKAYLKNHIENINEVEHIIDFLGSDAAPKRLRKMSYAQAKAGAAKWVKALAKRGKDIDDTNQLEIIKAYKDGFKLVRLVGKGAFEREGKLMAHCVGIYFGKETCEIYSLRDEDNAPHCTIELTRGENQTINQIKGKGNGSIHPKYINKVLDILEHFNVEVRESEMSNLGYIALTPFEQKLILKKFPKLKVIKFKKGTYLYNEKR